MCRELLKEILMVLHEQHRNLSLIRGVVLQRSGRFCDVCTRVGSETVQDSLDDTVPLNTMSPLIVHSSVGSHQRQQGDTQAGIVRTVIRTHQTQIPDIQVLEPVT